MSDTQWSNVVERQLVHADGVLETSANGYGSARSSLR